MPITIGSNIASLSAQRQLARSGDALASTFERLASGQRINRASDDAAGLAVSTALNARSRVFAQGVRNLNDGASMLAVADSALENLGQIVTRLQELAEQAANGTYSNFQRKALDQEAQALSKEFTRITRSTSFNQLNLFDGSLGSGVVLQGGFGEQAALQTSFGDGVGKGTFQSSITFSTATAGTTVRLADLNGDGRDDLVSGQQSRVLIQISNGDGTFGAAATISFGGAEVASDIALRDINGDGTIDLMHGTQSGYVRAYLNNGSGTFTAGQSIGLLGTFDRGALLELTDLNGDGYADAAIASANGDVNAVINIAFGRGDGTFGTITSYSFGDARATSLNVKDFDGNGTLDLLASTTNGAYLFRGTSSGSFANATTVATQQILSSTSDDIDGNGTVDLIATDFNNGIYVFSNNGNGTFTLASSFDERLGGSTQSNGIQTSDLNSDGHIDIVATGRTEAGGNAGLNVYYGRGNGTFSAAVTMTSAASGGDEYGLGVAVGDVNGDGGLDIVSTGYFNTGTAGFISTMLAEIGTGVSSLLPFSLQTQLDARDALQALSKRAQRLASQRGTIGAFASRLEVANSNLFTSRDVSLEAAARITDVNIASESAELIRKQIIQQAGASVLRQANLQPEIALQLLKNG